MKQKRQQLTLFVNPNDSSVIEKIREEFNTAQFSIIKAHATLCREDEIENLDHVLENLKNLSSTALTIYFGKPIRFADGNGVLLPAVGDNTEFHNLRKAILQGEIESPRKHEPHITLMHPRNSVCTDKIFGEILLQSLPKSLNFNRISLIEHEIEKPWKILEEFELKSA